jgi:pimeloyl-ACP methyl ester carboxylesterase
MKTAYLTNGKYPVRYRVQGSGYPLVFLHGYLESADIWTGFATAFPKSFRIVAIDLPGHGKSGVPGPVATMDEMAAAVVGVMDELDIKKFFVVGHSMGGYTALALLEHFPDRLSGICLFHSHTRADNDTVIEKRTREIRIVEQGHSNLLVQQNIPNMFAGENLLLFNRELRFTQRIARKTPDQGIIAAIRGLMERPDRSDILANAKVPCLQIIGRKDKYISFEEVSMKTILPADSERLILDYAGHMGFMEEKAKAYEGIISFLRNLI